jgi:hypothetical protein
MNEKFFQYYKRTNVDKILERFGGYIQIYHNTHKGTLFLLINSVILSHKDDISFMIDYMNPSTDDIIIPKGVGINHQPEELIIQKPGEVNGGVHKIVIPYGTDLTNLEYRLSGSGEGVSPEYIIDEITAQLNRYIGVDQCYNLFESHELFSISYEMNNKFFQYFTKLDADDNMEAFGVLVQIYNKDFTGNLLKIGKQGNRIELGSETYTSEGNKILYKTETVLQGYTEVTNYTGFKLKIKLKIHIR